MTDISEMIACRLAAGAITPEEYDQLNSRLRLNEPNHKVITTSVKDLAWHVQLYSVFRDYIEHEDDLINHRLGWNFSIQGFVFGAYAFAFQKTAELWNTLAQPSGQPARDPYKSIHSLVDIHIVLIIFAVLGISVGLVILASVKAATIAIRTIDLRWQDVHTEYKANENKPTTHGLNPPGLPGIVGGGDPKAASTKLFQAPRNLPWITIVGWLALLGNSCYELWSIVHLTVN